MMISSAENAESPTKCLLVELFDGPERAVRVEIRIARRPGYRTSGGGLSKVVDTAVDRESMPQHEKEGQSP